jgi:hypothetical protein
VTSRAQPANPPRPAAHSRTNLPLAVAALALALSSSRSAAADEEVPAAMIGDAATPGTLISARVVSAVLPAAGVAGATVPVVADDRAKLARADQPVRLYALVQADVAGTRRWFSDAPAVRLDGKPLALQPLSGLPQASLRWLRVEPTVATMSNTESGAFRFEPVPYKRTAFAAAGSALADVRPTLTPDHGHGVGTMRYAIELSRRGVIIASPGPEARRGRGSGGLLDTVHRVSIRRDDTYLGYLTEMFGQPYIWASAGVTSRTHQSERLEGSDCADFIIYGARRMGKALDYTWSGGLPSVTRLLAPRGERGEDGVYRDATGTPLPFPSPGDIILFPRHVGALTQDRGQLGILDDQDLMMHTLFDSPKEQAIADSGYAQTAVELRRWKK